MLIFSGLVVIAAVVLIVGSLRRSQPGEPRAKPVAIMVLLASSVGLLLSAATLYLTYRPYWYILQRVIENGDTSQTRDLRDFLAAAQWPPGIGFRVNLSVYFWAGVTLLGFVALAIVVFRHFQGHPRPKLSG